MLQIKQNANILCNMNMQSYSSFFSAFRLLFVSAEKNIIFIFYSV